MAISTIGEFLQMVIKQKVKAQEFYHGALKIITLEETRNFINMLIAEETKQAEHLKSLYDEEIYDNNAPIESYVELTKITNAYQPDSYQWQSDTSLKEAYQVALTKEHNGSKFLTELSALPLSQEAVTLLKKLAEGEIKSRQIISEQYYIIRGSLGKELG